MRFSDIEKRDLLKAWVTLSLAVSILKIREISAIFGLDPTPVLIVRAFAIYSLTIGVAFLAHEVMGHKLVAQRFGLFAEFLADDLFLLLALFSSFWGFVFAAPGAVVISGVTRIDTYGKIAAAGPLVNIILALIFGILSRVGGSLVIPIYQNQGFDLVSLGYLFNSWLALFNLFPFGVLDGAKVFAWDKRVWGVLTVTAALLFLGVI